MKTISSYELALLAKQSDSGHELAHKYAALCTRSACFSARYSKYQAQLSRQLAKKSELQARMSEIQAEDSRIDFKRAALDVGVDEIQAMYLKLLVENSNIYAEWSKLDDESQLDAERIELQAEGAGIEAAFSQLESELSNWREGQTSSI